MVVVEYYVMEHFVKTWFSLERAFLPARHCACTGLCESNISVRPSVRPSVRLFIMSQYCVKTKKASVIISSPSGSPTILVF